MNKKGNIKGAFILIPFIIALCINILAGCSTFENDQYKNCWETVAVERGETEGKTTQKQEETKTKETATKEKTSKKGKTTDNKKENQGNIQKNGTYTSKEDVAAYIHEYGKLPTNFITKKEAKALGWEGGSLEEYAPGKCIGGDYFGNYEDKLPKSKGRKYYECDIDTLGARSRGAKRIIYSSDGLIYYTSDHYETFTQLYK